MGGEGSNKAPNELYGDAYWRGPTRGSVMALRDPGSGAGMGDWHSHRRMVADDAASKCRERVLPCNGDGQRGQAYPRMALHEALLGSHQPGSSAL